MGGAIQKQTKQNNAAYWIKFALVLLIQLVFWVLPPVGGLTELGMKILGIFIGTLVGWCICDSIWPSLVCMILLGLSGYNGISKLVSTAAGNDTVLNLFFIMIFSGAVTASGFSSWAGQWLISRKILKGRPLLLSVFIVLAMYILEPFASLATLILLWDVVYIVVRQVELEDGNKWPKILVFETLLVVAVGYYYSFQRAVLSLSGLAKASDPNFFVEGYPFIIYGLIVTLLIIGTSFLALFLIYRPDLSKLKTASVEPPPPMNGKQRFTMWMILAYIIAQILPSILPDGWAFTGWISQFGVVGTTIVFIILFFVVRINGENVVGLKECINKGVLWGPLFMTATALTVAGALTSEGTGVTEALNTLLIPLFDGLSPFAFSAIIIIAAVVLTNLMNNLVVAALLIPIVFTTGPEMGVNPTAIFMVLLYACYLAVLLPSSNPITSFMFGSKDKIDSKSIMSFALITIVTGTLVLIFVALPLANFFY